MMGNRRSRLRRRRPDSGTGGDGGDSGLTLDGDRSGFMDLIERELSSRDGANGVDEEDEDDVMGSSRASRLIRNIIHHHLSLGKCAYVGVCHNCG